jgi:dTDP-4-dehydrorhamnose reductase
VELVAELGRRGHETAGFSRQQLDITDPAAIDAALDRARPEWVFNAAAYNLVDLAEREPEAAMRVNGVAVRSIATAAQRHGATLLHFSTDHVFDGAKREPYKEDDPPNPPSAYAISKLAGELYARAYCEKLYIVRVAGVFGPAGRTTRRSNFPELVLRKAAEGAPLRVVEDFFATPTYAPALAPRAIELLEKAPSGLYHLGGGTAISWYHYALKILEIAGLRADIAPTNHREYVMTARRPMHAQLSNAKAESHGIRPMPSLDEALTKYLRLRERFKPQKARGTREEA